MRGWGAAQTFDALLTRAGAKGDLIEKLKGNVAAGTAFKTKNCFRAAIGASGQRKVFSSPTLQGARGKCVRGGGVMAFMRSVEESCGEGKPRAGISWA